MRNIFSGNPRKQALHELGDFFQKKNEEVVVAERIIRFLVVKMQEYSEALHEFLTHVQHTDIVPMEDLAPIQHYSQELCNVYRRVEKGTFTEQEMTHILDLYDKNTLPLIDVYTKVDGYLDAADDPEHHLDALKSSYNLCVRIAYEILDLFAEAYEFDEEDIVTAMELHMRISAA